MAHLQEWQNSGGIALSAVNSDGSLALGSSSLSPVTPILAYGQQGSWERDTSDGNGFQFSWLKTRGGAACQANDSIGDLAFDFMNTTPSFVQAAVLRGIVNNPTAGSESAGFQFYCKNAGSMGLRVQITSNGNVLASGFVNTSDMRFKEDITPIDNALDKITHLNGVYFKWNQEYRERLKRSDSQTRQVGLVAQQVREVIPEIVAKMRDQEAGDYLAVDYNRLVPVLIQAVKEQQTQISEQQSNVQQLQEHNEKLLERIAILERTVKQFAAS